MRLLLAGLAASLVIAPAALVHAKPKSASVDAVYLSRTCAASPCTSGDHALARGSIVSGKIEIHVSAHSGLAGLDRIRLEALVPPEDRAAAKGDYACVQQWFGDRALDWSAYYVWDTATWPAPKSVDHPGAPVWGCPEGPPHFHGEPSINGSYSLRVIAWDVGDNPETDSIEFPIKLANTPRTPAWAAPPEVIANGPSVTLKWVPNKERDISEYHFVRLGPGEGASEFAVSAKNPSAQGCSKVSSIYYVCHDRGFTRSGIYRYALVALRPSPGGQSGRCSLTGIACIESNTGAIQEARVEVSPVTASPTASASASSGAPVTGSAPLVAVPSAVPSAEAARHEALLSTSPKDTHVPWSVAAGALLVIVAGMLWMARKKVLLGPAPKHPA